MTTPIDEKGSDAVREFEENPYHPENRRPEDVVRLFYVHNVPVIPVVSKRGMLIGILRKEDVIAELSDIDRASAKKIDEVITALARKMSLDELLPYATRKEFLVINIFGEVQGNWTRLQLLSAAEAPASGERIAAADADAEKQKEEQVLEWMIYLILEHIPRPLYALNKNGKTIFFNSYFDELFRAATGGDVDTAVVERSLKDTERNELLSSRGDQEILFYNRDYRFYYEKVPLVSKKKRVGFLIFCDRNREGGEGLSVPGVDVRGMSLPDIMNTVERQLLVDALRREGDVGAAAKHLGINRKMAQTKVERHGIDVKKIK